MALSIRGNVMDNTAAQNKHVATAHAIPTSVNLVSISLVFSVGSAYLCAIVGKPQPST